MAKNDFVKPTSGGAYPLGHAKENKDASAYINNVSSSDGKATVNPNTRAAKDVTTTTEAMDVNISGKKQVMNPYGVGEMRGYGAATKGRKISGKMG